MTPLLCQAQGQDTRSQEGDVRVRGVATVVTRGFSCREEAVRPSSGGAWALPVPAAGGGH